MSCIVPSTGGRSRLRFFSALVLLSAGLVSTEAEERAVLKIEPGPATMSAEERSITQDMSQGRQHGVVLVDETVRDESSTVLLRIAHHFRAKILSNEARGLADVVIPYEAWVWGIERWWGRTILPDGRVIELERRDLKEQTLMQGAGWSMSIRKAALPGVVPGCVIDYGYVVSGGDLDEWVVSPLQRPWPIREFRYQWFPASWLPSQYFVQRVKGVDVEVTRQEDGVFIEGNDLPPALDEPWMPPKDLVRAGIALFYNIGRPSPDPNAFWNAVATDEEKRVSEFIGGKKALKKALAMIPAPDEAPLDARLRAAYAWLDQNFVNESMLTSEERAAAGEEIQKRDPESRRARVASEPPTAERVLSARRAGREELRYLFVGLARALGASASSVMAVDRRDRNWQRSMLSKGQIDQRAIAVRDPGTAVEKSTFVDPGSGLPYGSIPWWLTPSQALVATDSGAVEIQLEASAPRQNVMESNATIALSGKDAGSRVEWSARGSGQSGYEERLRLRSLDPTERQERIEKLCGASGDFEVARAAAPDLGDLTAGYHIVCEGQLVNVLVDDTQDRFELSIAGAWIPEAPWFPSATRDLPVVFSYPHIDLTTIEVAAPPGFVPAQAPEVVKLEGPYGSYGLKLTKTAQGYRVERAFALTMLSVAVSEYDRLRSFLDQVRLEDRTRLDFVRPGDTP